MANHNIVSNVDVTTFHCWHDEKEKR